MTRAQIERYLPSIFAILFSLIGWLLWRSSPGDDLSSGYIACRLLAQGESEALYVHHPALFHVVNDPRWTATALKAGFSGFLHPYVQTPLWAAALLPLCTTLSFPIFSSIFVLIACLSTAFIILLAIRPVQNRVGQAVIAAIVFIWLSCSAPYQYSLFLAQTHALLMLLAIAAFFLERCNRPFSGGALLAVAAAVKITPVFFILYWVLTGRWKAAIASLIGITALTAASFALTGVSLNLAYFSELQRISTVLLVAFNNQSFAAAVMGVTYRQYIASWEILPLPALFKVLSPSLSVGCVALAALFQRRGASGTLVLSVVLLSATLFSPIAWTHYFFILAVPVVALLADSLERRHVWPAGAAVLIMVLCIPPIAVDAVSAQPSAFGLTRSVFLAGLVGLISCVWIGLRRSTERSTIATISSV